MKLKIGKGTVMEQVKCPFCGSGDIVLRDEVFVCQGCGHVVGLRSESGEGEREGLDGGVAAAVEPNSANVELSAQPIESDAGAVPPPPCGEPIELAAAPSGETSPVFSGAAPVAVDAASGKKPKWKKILLILLIVIAVIAAAIAAGVAISDKMYRDTHANVPDVIGMSPAEAVNCLEKTTDMWTVRYDGVGDLSDVPADELNADYEVADIDPAVGTSLSTEEAGQIVTIYLRKTVEALTNDAIAGFSEYTESIYLSHAGFYEPCYIVDSCYRAEGDSSEWWSMIDEEQAIVKTLAGQLGCPVIWLVHGPKGSLVGTYVGLPSGIGEDEVKSAAEILKTLQSDENIGFPKNLENASSYIDGLCSDLVDGDHGYGSVETKYSEGKLVVYVHEEDGYWRVRDDGEEISDAEYDGLFLTPAKSLAFFLQTPVTVNYYQNNNHMNGLRSSITVDPVQYYKGE